MFKVRVQEEVKEKVTQAMLLAVLKSEMFHTTELHVMRYSEPHYSVDSGVMLHKIVFTLHWAEIGKKMGRKIIPSRKKK